MTVSVSVVATTDELAQAFAIRSAVFIGEQKCPYEEEFDGNDFCATHILGRIGGLPAGTARLRWFSDFVKFERFSVLSRFRHSDLSGAMVRFCLELCRRKGFHTAYAHSQRRLVHHWAKYGFNPLKKDPSLIFSDHEYVEIICHFTPHPEPISLKTDPYILLRPEGDWDRPGVLEGSATRPPTNPH